MHPQLAPWHFGYEVWQMRLWMKELNIRSFKKDNQARYSTADPKMPSSFCFLPSSIWLYLSWIMEMKIVFRCSALLIPPIFEVNSYQIYQILFMDPYPKLEVESATYASQKPRTFSGLSCGHGLSTWHVPKLHSWKFEDHGECCLNFFQNVWYQGVLYHFQIETGRFQEVKLYDRITFQVSDFLSSKASTTNRLPFGSPLEGWKTSVKFQIFPGNGVWNSGLLAIPKLFHSEQFTKKKVVETGFLMKWWDFLRSDFLTFSLHAPKFAKADNAWSIDVLRDVVVFNMAMAWSNLFNRQYWDIPDTWSVFLGRDPVT